MRHTGPCVCTSDEPTKTRHRTPLGMFGPAEKGLPGEGPRQKKYRNSPLAGKPPATLPLPHPPTLYLTQSPTSQCMGIIFPLGTILPGPTFTTSPMVGRLERVADSAMSTPAEEVVVPFGTAFTFRRTLSPIMRDVSRLICRRESHPERVSNTERRGGNAASRAGLVGVDKGKACYLQEMWALLLPGM